MKTRVHDSTGFSSFDVTMRRFEAEAEMKQLLRPAPPWPDKERTPENVAKRRDEAMHDFWAFDRHYFPPQMYPQGKAQVSSFHKSIVKIGTTPGVQILLGPRSHAKTATAKKLLVWMLMTGRKHLMGIYCETLPKASNAIDDVRMLIFENERILHDYRPTLLEANADQLEFHLDDGKRRTVAAFSEGRSVRGFVRGFARPEYLLVDDMETLQSPMEGKQVKERIFKLRESVASLTDGSTALVLGNNFDARGALNQLKLQADNGVLRKGWNIHIFKAWTKGRPLWPQRYPAATEEHLKDMVGAADEHDWQSNYQQNPIPPEGFIFTREYLKFWDRLPKDVRGVVYVDPNLALKSKGDTTAIVRMLFSPSTQLFYVTGRCRSYDDPGELLTDALEMRTANVRGLGFDGHVNQESHWHHHIKAWCREHGMPYPLVEFKQYKVDQLATNAQAEYKQGRFLFDPAMKGSEEGDTFFTQFFAFHSKKARRKDDAPDAVICAHEFITERRLVKRSHGSANTIVHIIEDVY